MKWFKQLFNENLVVNEVLQDNELARAEQELKILHKSYIEAVNFLRKNYKRTRKLPLFLTMGRPNFGKTSLLAKSGLNLKDVHGRDIQTILSTKYFSWLFSDEAVFLDVAGVYAKTDKASPHHNLVWIKFLKKIKHYLLRHPISGMIVAIDIPTLLGPTDELHKVLEDISERVYEVAQYTKRLPIFIVFTKADLLPGFTDFFAEMSLAEREQIFGINFPKVDGVIDPAFTFEADYNSLLCLLDEHRAVMLQKKMPAVKEALINNFYLQIAKLRGVVAKVIGEIPYGAGIELQGVYFTSSVQSYAEGKELAADSNVADFSQIFPLVSHGEAYFVKDLFAKILANTNANGGIGGAKEMSWSQFVIMVTMAWVLGASTMAWYYSYSKTLRVINSVHELLQSKQQGDDLNRLEAAIAQVGEAKASWFAHLGFAQVGKLHSNLKEAYYQKVAATFTAELQKNVEAEIAVRQGYDNKALYNALKVYLMLSDPGKIDVVYVKAWFDKYLEKNLPNDLEGRKHFAFELASVLEHGVKFSQSDVLIAKAREALNSHNIPERDLVYETLESAFVGQNLVFKFGAKELKISKMYTAANFKKIYEQQIPAIIYGLGNKNKDWILEEGGKVRFSSNEANKIIDEVRQLYIKTYVDAWSKSVEAISLGGVDNVKQVSSLISDINKGNFPLFSFLEAAKNSLLVERAPAQFNQLVAAAFDGLQDVDVKPIRSAMSDLTKYFAAINKGSDIDKNAFLAAASRFRQADLVNDPITSMRQLALKEPKSIQDWLQSIADGCWHGLLNSAHGHINTVWTTTVVSEYKKTLSNKYPLFKDAQNSISLNDFTRFFASGGAMDSFFNNYLKPFVDTDQLYWVWKDLDGRHLDISQDKLELFIRSALIKKMFYPAGGTVPKVKFTLIAKDLTPTTKDFTLNLEGQTISYVSGEIKTDSLVWPGNGTGKLNIAFTNNQGRVFNADMSSDAWVLFRFLDKSNIRVVNGTQHFEFTVDLNANAVKYELVSEQPINPFIPGIIDNFRCPEKL